MYHYRDQQLEVGENYTYLHILMFKRSFISVPIIVIWPANKSDLKGA